MDKNNKDETLLSLKAYAGEIGNKYKESFDFLERRKKRQVNQLSLLNNLQRGDETIASTMLITLFLRVLSNNYDDKMQVKFTPGEEIDQKKVNSINILAQNDYREMDKSRKDYDIMFDSLFFGTGYWETLRFDKKRKLMIPDVINPLMLGYDPFFSEVDDWRYYWKWKLVNKWQLMKMIQANKLFIKEVKEIPSGIDPYLWDYKVKREEATLATPQANDTPQGDVFQILEYFGYDAKGDKCIFWTDRDQSKVIYKEKLDLRDGEEIFAPDGSTIDVNSKWPIVRKNAFKIPHSTVNFSVADLLEDKHRAESVLLNLAFIAAKDKANPLYWYDPDKIKDITQLFNRQISQHIPTIGPGSEAVGPLNTANPMDAGLMAFMQTLNQKANDPMGTGMALNPNKKGKQSATETAIQQQLNDLAQSLQSKVLKFGEEDFWSDWYQRYIRFSKEGDEKIATIVGVKGITFENIKLADIKTKYPPGIIIYSAKEAEYKELVLRRELTQLRGDFASSWTPDAIRSFDKHVLLPKYIQDPQMVEVLQPKTIDELNAEAENELFGRELPVVQETDNHEQHLAVHYMAPNTWAKWIHIHWHQELLGLQKKQQQNPEGGMNPGGDGQQGGEQKQGNKPNFGNDKMDSKSSASPLKQEIQAAPKQ